jgi:hypothetical protein
MPSPHDLSDSRSGPSHGKDDREGVTADTVVASGLLDHLIRPQQQ